MKIADPTMRLTPPQRRVLEHMAVTDDGSMPCGPGMGRAHDALAARGLIVREPENRITDAGRAVLAANRA